MIAVQALLILAGILIMLYAGNTLTPAINAARDAGPAEHARFERLHRRSVRLNGLVLTIGLGLVIAQAARPAPRSAGIPEMTPAERARYDAEIGAVLSAIETRQGERLDNPNSGQPGAGASVSRSTRPQSASSSRSTRSGVGPRRIPRNRDDRPWSPTLRIDRFSGETLAEPAPGVVDSSV